MSEGPRLEPSEAIRQIQRIQSFDAALRARTAGITWMLWGLAIAGIFLSFAVAAGAFGIEYPLWAYFLWVPWAFLGAVATIQLWRSTRLVVILDARTAVRRVVVAVAAGLAGVYLSFAVGAWLLQRYATGFWAYVGLGGAAAVFALMGFPSRDAVQRRVMAAAGVLLMAIGVLAGIAAKRNPDDANLMVLSLVSAIAAALVCTGAGLYVAGRG